jgi:hypothetical protein
MFHVNLLCTEAHFTSHADNSLWTGCELTCTKLADLYSLLLCTPLLVPYWLVLTTHTAYWSCTAFGFSYQRWNLTRLERSALYCWLALTTQKTSRCCYCCMGTDWGHVVLPYCCATQYSSCNLATRGAMRREGKGGKARRVRAPLLLCNRVPWGFWISAAPTWGDYATICKG